MQGKKGLSVSHSVASGTAFTKSQRGSVGLSVSRNSGFWDQIDKVHGVKERSVSKPLGGFWDRNEWDIQSVFLGIVDSGRAVRRSQCEETD